MTNCKTLEPFNTDMYTDIVSISVRRIFVENF